MKTLNVSQADIDALARIVQAEAGNQPASGRLAVLFSVLNRAAAGKASGFADTIQGVIEQDNQFEPMLGANSYLDLPPAPASLSNEIALALEGIATGALSDPTAGSTFFQNPSVTRARGTDFAEASPVTTIGDHAFYNRYGTNDPVSVPPYSVTLSSAGNDDALIVASPSPSVDAVARRLAQPTAPYANIPPSQRPQSAYQDSNEGVRTLASGYRAGRAALRGRSAAPSRASSSAAIPPSQAEVNPASPEAALPALNPDGTYTYNLVASGDHVDLSGLDPQARSAALLAASIFGKDLTINSGFRSQAKQDSLKAAAGANNPRVANKSRHTHGDALDISIQGMSDTEVAALVDSLVQAGFTGFGWYGKNSHLHADMRSTVPNSFGSKDGWGGWTVLPVEVFDLLKRRGFAPGGASSSIYRGAL